MQKLAELMAHIDGKYTFTGEHYPELSDKSPDATAVFAVKHSAFHMMKSVGAIAAECERIDHGGKAEMRGLKVATAKMLINTLKLASELGMTAKELAELVPEVMRSK